MEYEYNVLKVENSTARASLNPNHYPGELNTTTFLSELNQILNSLALSVYNSEAETDPDTEEERIRRRKASTANSVDNWNASIHPEEERSNLNNERSSDRQASEREENEEDALYARNLDYYRKLAVVKTEKYKFIGEMRNGKRDGFGVCYYTGGEVYTGQWKEDKKDGLGKMILPSGDLQMGELKDGKFEGFCEVINYKKELEIRGCAVNGRIRGEIVAKIGEKVIEGCNLIISEDFSGVQATPVCKIILSNDSYFLGEINLHNYCNILTGILVKRKEFIYMGEILILSSNNFSNNFELNLLSNGYGEYYYNDLSRFYGFFQSAKKEGLGLHLYSDGRILFGNYTDNVKSGAFFQLTKNTASATSSISSAMKMEIYHLGFKSKTVEKQENIKKYLPLNYPEFSFILKFNYKEILNKLWDWDLKEDEDLMREIIILNEEECVVDEEQEIEKIVDKKENLSKSNLK